MPSDWRSKFIDCLQWLAHFATLGLLSGAFVGACFWCYFESDEIEPFVTAAALVAAVTVIYGERWANGREQRKALLHAVAQELLHNRQAIKNYPFELYGEAVPAIFPRLGYFALANAATSSEFLTPYFRELLSAMLNSHGSVVHINRTLELVETIRVIAPERGDIAIQEIQYPNAMLTQARARFDNLNALITGKYSRDSGVTHKTQFLMVDVPN